MDELERAFPKCSQEYVYRAAVADLRSTGPWKPGTPIENRYLSFKNNLLRMEDSSPAVLKEDKIRQVSQAWPPEDLFNLFLEGMPEQVQTAFRARTSIDPSSMDSYTSLLKNLEQELEIRERNRDPYFLEANKSLDNCKTSTAMVAPDQGQLDPPAKKQRLDRVEPTTNVLSQQEIGRAHV